MDPKQNLAKYKIDKLLAFEWKDTDKGIAKYSYRESSPSIMQSLKGGVNMSRHYVGASTPLSQEKEEKVLLVVGATGAGKSTLINGIVNYIFGVEFEDKFRFILIHDETSHSQAFSHTDLITVYTFYWQEGFPFPYTITLIDTPGFGNTRGLPRDKKIVAQIKHLFELSKDNGGIEALHGIGFVIQAALARLTPTQQYIFDSILAVFGKDVTENISIMATFADSAEVQVMSAITVKVQANCFKFNNSALFSSYHDNFSKMFWQMGAQSFKDFFDVFGSAQVASLQLTKEVLRECEQIEVVISGLQVQLHLGLSKMEELNTKKKVLKEHEADIITNEKFTVTYKVDTRFDVYQDEVTETFDDLQKKYNVAKQGKTQIHGVIIGIEREMDEIFQGVVSNIQQLNKSITRLDEIALKPNHLDDVQYIDILIESEKQQANQGYLDRIKYLNVARERAVLLIKIASGKANMKEEELSFDMLREWSNN